MGEGRNWRWRCMVLAAPLALFGSALSVGDAGATSSADAGRSSSGGVRAAVDAASAENVTFNYTGDWQYFTVPVGVHDLQITASGGAGGDGQGTNGGGTGGSGGQVSGTVSVNPGQVLTLWVGGGGTVSGSGGLGDPVQSWSGGNGGAYSGGESGNGGGGGSASYVSANGAPLLVGGGGGGGGGSGCVVGYPGGAGGGGGNPATNGNGGNGAGSGGGGETGAGGTNGGTGSGGASLGGGGGGGGGGYTSGTGGGGGYAGCGGGGGGGGGSSFADPSVSAVLFVSADNAQSANGQILIDLGPAGTTQTFTSTTASDYQYFTVPAGVNSLFVTVAGGSGGSGKPTPISPNPAGAGGSGGLVSGTLAVTPGQVLSLWVGHGGQEGGVYVVPVQVLGGAGGQGDPAGEAYNGGNGGVCTLDPGSCTGWGDAGGGGSAGTVSVGGVPVLVAGGGGGGGANGGNSDSVGQSGPGGGGGLGGDPPTVGHTPPYNGFIGGAGGATGLASTDGGNGNDTAGKGTGDGTTDGGSGGGGGGGAAAGGGGNAGGDYFTGLIDITGGGGGGGGTSYAAPSVSEPSFSAAGNGTGTDSSGNSGWITISYRQGSTTSLASSSNPVGPQQTVNYSATVTGDGGGTVDFTSDGNQGISGCIAVPLEPVTGGAAQATCTTTSTSPGSHPIAAYYSGDASFSASSATLTQVVSGYPNSAATISSTVNPSAAGQATTFELTSFESVGGSTVSFVADGSPLAGCSSIPVSHRSTGPAWYAECTTGALAAGPHTVTGTYNGDSLYAAVSASLTQTVLGPLDHIELSPSSGQISLGGSTTFKAEGYDAAGDDLGDVTAQATFSIAPDGSCATATCTASVSGSHTVTASVGTVSATATLVVTTTARITISPLSTEQVSPASQTYQVEGYDSMGNDVGNVTTDSVFSIAPNGSCSGSICEARQPGLHTITADDGGVTATAQLQVDVSPVYFLVLSPQTATVAQGGSQTYKAEGYDIYGDDLGDFTSQATFSISPDGTCTESTCTPGSTGDHTVTATYAYASGTATLHVATVFSIQATPSGSTIPAGGTQTYQVEGYDLYGNDLGNVTAQTTLSISPDGSCTGATCTATKPGVHSVTATEGSNGFEDVLLTVTPGSLDHLTLSPPSATVDAGGSQAYTAEGFDRFGNDTGDVTAATTFSVSPGATCSGATCAAFTAGSHTVTGTDGSVAGTAILVARAGPVARLVLAPPMASVPSGASQAYTAEGFDTYGNDLGDMTTASTLTIGPDGTCAEASCAATMAGSHVVTASDGGATGTASLTVTPGPLDHLVLSPGAATIGSRGSQRYTAEGYDAASNDIGDVTAGTTFSIGPDGSCTGATCRATTFGPHTVTGTDAAAVGSANLVVVGPVVASVNPSVGPAAGAQAVTITGTRFTGATGVTFGGIAATNVVVVSDSEIQVTTPPHAAGATDVRVTTPDGRSPTGTGDLYRYRAAPTVTGLSPNAGPDAGDGFVSVTGSGFTGGATVKFGATPSPEVKVRSASLLRARVPSGTGIVDVTVTSVGGTSVDSTADRYAFDAVPIVTSVSPDVGPVAGGQAVTITGTGFTGATQVDFHDVLATNLVVVSDTEVTVTSPPHAAGRVHVRVVTPGGRSPLVNDMYHYS